jgi:hypothetical protein
MVLIVGAQFRWRDRAIRERKFIGTLSQIGASGLISSRFSSIFLYNYDAILTLHVSVEARDFSGAFGRTGRRHSG